MQKSQILLLVIIFSFSISCNRVEEHSNEYPSSTPPRITTSRERAAEATQYFLQKEYGKAIEPYERALELEKAERRLNREMFITLIKNLSESYRQTGNSVRSIETLEFGTTQEPDYPIFYYSLARHSAESGDEENTIKWLRLAYKNKAQTLADEALPDPMRDGSFQKVKGTQKFRDAFREMQRSVRE
jgi:tetratricopeptide (TPR) repeat protein